MAEAVIAWRAWGLTKPHFLSSPNSVWIPREVFEASCEAHKDHIDIPNSDCTCGIYSFKAPQDLANYFRISRNRAGHPAVIGQVKIWGKIIQHRLGYRSQFAYPMKLWILDLLWHPFAPLIQDLYGIPVEIDIASDFPEPVDINGKPAIQPRVSPVAPRLQYSVLRTELRNLVELSDGHNIVNQIAGIILENLDVNRAITASTLFDALVLAKHDGRLNTQMHPWHAFISQQSAFKLFVRHHY